VHVTDASEEKSQVVVDLGGGAHGAARRFDVVLLADRDRWADSLDGVDVGAFHALQELLRVGGQRLDVAALPFSVERVEDERALPRSAHTTHDHEAPSRQFEIDVSQIVLSRAQDPDRLHENTASPPARDTCNEDVRRALKSNG
jgi:hypothetical protein